MYNVYVYIYIYSYVDKCQSQRSWLQQNTQQTIKHRGLWASLVIQWATQSRHYPLVLTNIAIENGPGNKHI